MGEKNTPLYTIGACFSETVFEMPTGHLDCKWKGRPGG